MKTIKIKFVDFDADFDVQSNYFIDILKKHYQVEISDNPDYLFYSCFGYEHSRYSCIKIFYTGECETPDFNLCDYAMGFDHLQFGDRYLRVPLYLLFQYEADLALALQKHMKAEQIIAEGRGFCSFVVSNDAGQPARKEAFDLLSSYKQVASGGRYLNNIGYRVPDKQAFLEGYKFNLAFENCNYYGYTTEKIVQAFAAGCIPIYYGDPNIAAEFNPKSFVNGNAFASWDEVLEEVRRIDTDPALYAEMLHTPILPEGKARPQLEEFLIRIFDQEYADARRRPINSHIREMEAWRRFIRVANTLYTPFRRLGNLIRRIKSKSL